MKKRLLCICLIALLLIQSAALADVEKVKLSGNTCIITGTANAGEVVGILVTNGGETGGDIDKAITFSSPKIAKSGSFSYSLNMSESRINANKLSIFVKVGQNARKEFILDYVSPADLAELIKSMKNTADSKKLQEILNNASNLTALTALGFEMDLWNASDKINAALILFNNKACFDKTTEDIEKEFTKAVLLSSYHSSKLTPTEVTDCLNEIKAVEISDKKWSEIKKNTEISSKVLSYLQKNASYTSIDDLISEFGAGSVFYDLVNAGAYGTVRDLLNKYKDVLNMGSQSYYIYYNQHQEAVAKKLLTQLASVKQTGIDSKAKFHTMMETAVANAKESETAPVQSGGGGNKSTSTPIVAPVITNPENNIQTQNPEGSGSFHDMANGHWAYDAVEKLHEKKVINGYEDGTFLPDKKVTREEFLTMLLNALDIATIGGTCPFEDVEYGKWYSPYVTTAWLKGMISGVDKDRFGLGEEISRQDMAAILMRSGSEYATEDIREYTAFIDEGDISDYAKDAIKKMYELKVVNGADGYFNPKSSASRAETAVMIYNFINLTNGGES